MPGGHTVHRIALQFAADFVGHAVEASSPQGRFAAGAALLDGATMVRSDAVGKHLFLGFERDGDAAPDRRWLRVHLGLYGAWDFAGRVTRLTPDGRADTSVGVPRRRAVRVGEGEHELADDAVQGFPPPPVGQVRLRLLTGDSLADLRGPTRCEVLTPEEVAAVIAKAGPDPRLDAGPGAEDEFVRRLTSRRTPVGVLLMDQSVVSGIGNVYRAELLFRARLDPFTVGRAVPEATARALWRDWSGLLSDGISTGYMLTREDLDDRARAATRRDRDARHWVYRREGEPCRVCGTPIAMREVAGRKLYWCPVCQAPA